MLSKENLTSSSLLSSPHKHSASSNFMYSNNIKSPSHMDCLLKCTCPKSPNMNALQHPLLAKQQNILEIQGSDTTYINRKSVCDANTSPGLRCIRSPKTDQKILNSGEGNLLKDKNLNDTKDQRYNVKPNPSPRRLISTRNAATSPHLDMRKVQRNELKTKDVKKEKFSEMVSTNNANVTSSANRASLEKSNSLGESKPNRQLRTTRSLSPRPPVRHQHAIMVSDENDIISVKVSPNDDYETSLNNNHKSQNTNGNNNIVSSSNTIHKNSLSNSATEKCDSRRKHKAKSEQTSPNISDFDGIFTYECKANNKSTGCLIYVPSDPWLKMPDSENSNDIIVSSLRKPKSNAAKNSKFSKESRSLSRGNIDTTDPWVWRKDSDNFHNISTSNNNIKRSPKQDAYRQSKSFSVTKFFENSTPENNICNVNNRPKLQRCKSPFFTEDEFKRALNNKIPPPPTSPTFLIAPPSVDNQYTSGSSIYNYPSVQQQQQQLQQPSSPSAICSKANRNNISANCSPRKDSTFVFQFQQQQQIQHHQSQQINKSLLNVLNPNVMQARHSFSSGSTLSSDKDDELQLNIRRLSEQIKHNQSSSNSGIVSIGSSSGGGADFSDYLKQFRCSEAKKAAAELAALQQSVSNANMTGGIAPSSLTHEQSVTKSPRNTTKNSDRVLETTC